MNYRLVIARYNESLDWLTDDNELLANSIVYNKGEPIGLQSEVTLSNDPNYTREADSYLSYIIDNYHQLPDYVFFSQGNPFEHSPQFSALLKHLIHNNKLKPYQPLSSVWKLDRCIPDTSHLIYNTLHDVDGYKIYMEQIDDRLLPIGQTDLGIIQLLSRFRHFHNIQNPFDTLPYLYSRLLLPQPYVGYIFFNYGAIFGVRKQNIVYHQLDYYKYLKQFLFEHDTHGYILERLWYTIFCTR